MFTVISEEAAFNRQHRKIKLILWWRRGHILRILISFQEKLLEMSEIQTHKFY